MAVALTIGCAAAVVGLLWSVYREWTRGRYLFKSVASGCFFAVALLGVEWAVDYERWVVVALAFGVGGDIALMVPHKRGFLVGLALFLFGHVFFCLALLTTSKDGLSPTPWQLVPVAGAAGALVYLWRHLGSLRVPVIVYMGTITAMVSIAVGVYTSGVVTTAVIVAACCFFLSDLAVARERFVEHSFNNRAWGLPLYYAAQMCFAWSVL